MTGVWITTDNPESAADPAVVAELAGCSGYWFVGGSQSRVMRVFRPASGDTPGYRAIMARWREGAVVAGSSAGAAMMSARSIGGGFPAEALAHGVVRDRDDDGEADGDGVWVLRGMDFVDWAIVGQHHLARGRWGRLVVAVLEEKDDLGVGIDENTALVYRDGVAEVMGASGVLVVDASGARAGELPRTATGIRLELLGPGDRLDVRNGAVTRVTAGRAVPPPRALGPGAEPGTSTSDGAAPTRPGRADLEADPFADWAFLHLLHAFATGEVEEITLEGGARTLTLRRGEGFTGFAASEDGVVDEAGTPTGLSVGPLLLDLSVPERRGGEGEDG
ncbi:MAG: cyanophycinase [Gammaproteobacteria bacterium]|nr:cyanophycinase [Gammaproteobacteria bacterium]